MAEQTVYSLLLALKGSQDPSLRAAFSAAEKNLKDLGTASMAMNRALTAMGSEGQKSARTIQSAFASIASTARREAAATSRAWSEAGERMHRAMRPLLGVLGSIGRFTGIGAAIGAIGGGFAAARFLGEGSNVAGERESILTQMRTVLTSKGMGERDISLWNQMRRYSDMESVFHLNPVVGVANQMLAAGFSQQEILPKMRKLGEISRDDETLALVGDIFSQARNQGVLSKGLLNRLFRDAKVPIYEALLHAMGQENTPQNQTALFKRLRNPLSDPISWTYLEKALDWLERAPDEKTGIGGAFYHHQIEQLRTYKGQRSSVDERIKDVLAGVGGISNQLQLPFMRDINKLSPTDIQDFFDRIEPSVLKFGEQVRVAMHWIWDTGRIDSAGAVLRDIFAKIGHGIRDAFGLKGDVSIVDIIIAAFDRMLDALRWVDRHMDDIIGTGRILLGVFVAINALKFTAGIVSAIGTITSALKSCWDTAIGAKGAIASVGVARAAGTSAAAEMGGFGILGTAAALTGYGFLAQTPEARAQNERLLENWGLSVDESTKAMDGSTWRIKPLEGKLGGMGDAISNFSQTLGKITDNMLLLPFSAGWEGWKGFHKAMYGESEGGDVPWKGVPWRRVPRQSVPGKPSGIWRPGMGLGPLSPASASAVHAAAAAGDPDALAVLSRYGYPGDPYGDTASGNPVGGPFTGHGIGNRNNALIMGTSAALSDNVALQNHLARGDWFKWTDASTGDVIRRRYDDTVGWHWVTDPRTGERRKVQIPDRFDIYDKAGTFKNYGGHRGKIQRDPDQSQGGNPVSINVEQHNHFHGHHEHEEIARHTRRAGEKLAADLERMYREHSRISIG